MSIDFQELAGSPRETYTSGGFRARRAFLIAWDDREAFAAAVLGRAAEHGGSEALRYPGKTAVVAVGLRLSPLDPKSLDRQTLPTLCDGLNSYRHSFAKAVVEYRAADAGECLSVRTLATGAPRSHRLGHDWQLERLPAAGWRWADAPGLALPSDYPLFQCVPVGQHRLICRGVVDPPWEAIQQLQGTVNATAFLGCPPQTLLFLGVQVRRGFRSGLDADLGELAWWVEYHFRQRAVKYGGACFGWNHFYREDPPGWVELTNGVQGVYSQADFTPLLPARAIP